MIMVRLNWYHFRALIQIVSVEPCRATVCFYPETVLITRSLHITAKTCTLRIAQHVRHLLCVRRIPVHGSAIGRKNWMKMQEQETLPGAQNLHPPTPAFAMLSSPCARHGYALRLLAMLPAPQKLLTEAMSLPDRILPLLVCGARSRRGSWNLTGDTISKKGACLLGWWNRG